MSDAFAPDTGQQVDPVTGKVTYSFHGNLGLDVDPAVNSSTVAQRVQWVRTDTGAVVAQHYAYDTDAGGTTTGVIAQHAPATGVHLALHDDPDVGHGFSWAKVITTGGAALLLDDLARSDFLFGNRGYTQPARLLDTTYTPDANHPVLLVASVRTTNYVCDLKVDGVIVSRVLSNTVDTGVVIALVPANSTYRLATTNLGGASAVAIDFLTEFRL